MVWDVIIAAVNLPEEEEYWQRRLNSSSQLIITVSDDWLGRAGSGLGSLSAYAKAVEKAKFKHQIDLNELIMKGAAAALFYTIGCGDALFPIVPTSGGSFSKIKLPGSFSLLELAIQHTAPLANQRKGRLSVFLGDRIIIPEKKYPECNGKHIEIFYRGEESTGYFSLTMPVLFALQREFDKELSEKKGYLDAAQFWNSMILPGTTKHYKRMQDFKNRFCQLHQPDHFIGITDFGKQALEWHFGTVDSYYKQSLKLTHDTPEGLLLRLVLGINPIATGKLCVIKDNNSCVKNCNIKSGKVINSVLVDVEADSIDVENCVVIGGNFTSLKAEGSLLYQVQEKNPLELQNGSIKATTILRDGRLDTLTF